MLGRGKRVGARFQKSSLHITAGLTSSRPRKSPHCGRALNSWKKLWFLARLKAGNLLLDLGALRIALRVLPSVDSLLAAPKNRGRK